MPLTTVQLSLEDVGAVVEAGVRFTLTLKDDHLPATTADHTVGPTRAKSTVTDDQGMASLDVLATDDYTRRQGLADGIYVLTYGNISRQVIVPLVGPVTARALIDAGVGSLPLPSSDQRGVVWSEDPPANPVPGMGWGWTVGGQLTIRRWDGNGWRAERTGGGGGTEVVANPTAAPTAELETVTIDGVVYSLAEPDVPAIVDQRALRAFMHISPDVMIDADQAQAFSITLTMATAVDSGWTADGDETVRVVVGGTTIETGATPTLVRTSAAQVTYRVAASMTADQARTIRGAVGAAAGVSAVLLKGIATFLTLDTTIRLEPPSSAADPTEQRVLVDVDAASADTYQKVAIESDGHAFTTRKVEHRQTPNSFTPGNYSNPNFLGVMDATPSPSEHDVGQWFVHGFTRSPRIVVMRGGSKDWADTSWSALGLTYLGAFPKGTVAEVAPHASADGQVYLDMDDLILRTVTAFVAGSTAAPDEYIKLSVATGQQIEALKEDIDNADIDQRVLVDVPASAETVDKLIIEDEELYETVDRVVHEGTPAQATFMDQLRPNRQFIGFFYDESALDPAFYAAGRWYYNLAENTERVNRYISGNSGPKHWVDGSYADLVDGDGVNVGHWLTDAEATPYVTKVGDVYVNDRQREYRQVATFTAGSGPVTAPQRRRVANADDLAVIGSPIDRMDFIAVPSPDSLDVNALPGAVVVNVTTETRRWDADTLRVVLLGQQTDIVYDPNSRQHRVSIPMTPAMQSNARLLTTGSNPAHRTQISVAVLDGNTELESITFDVRVESSPIGDLVDRTADLRVVPPRQVWEAASGTGVGVAISATLVTDLSTLTFSPSADVPSDATVGDAIYYYWALPTDANLSDYRLDLDGYSQLLGSSFGAAAGTVGDNSVYNREFSVGDGSGGVSSGTAPGATITLQHHGVTPHTAYSGRLEGAALEQVSGNQPLFQPSKSNLFEAVKAIFHPSTNSGVTADDANNELDVSGGTPYTLPAASPSTRGGVLAITQAIVDAGTSTGQFAWSIANVLRAVRSQIAQWSRRGDVSQIPVEKLGSGTPAATNVLHGDGAWKTITGVAAALTPQQQIGLIGFRPETPAIQYHDVADLVGTHTIFVDGPELLTGDIWVSASVSGAPVLARTKWTDTTRSIALAVDSTVAGNAANTGRLTAQLIFHDAASGGTQVAEQRVSISLNRIDGAQPLTSAAAITWSLRGGSTALLTLAHDATLNISTVGSEDGDKALLRVTQAAKQMGGWTLALHSSMRTLPGVPALVLSTANGAVDFLRFVRIGNVWYYAGMYPDEPVMVAALGQPNLDNAVAANSGVLVAGTGARPEHTVPLASQNVLWNAGIAGHSLPQGASLAADTGILTLPAGVWLIEAVLDFAISANRNSNRIFVQAQLYEGGQRRYTETLYYRPEQDSEGAVSVTGTLVIPHGSTDTVQVRYRAIGDPGEATLLNAHMEAIRLGRA